MQLPVLGSYSPTAPFDCPKSKRIFEQGCEALAGKMKANPNEGNHITRSLNALALLASGESEYLPLVREQVEWVSQLLGPREALLSLLVLRPHQHPAGRVHPGHRRSNVSCPT